MSYPQLAKIVIACAVGIILLITGIVFLVRYLVRRRKLKRWAFSNLATNASLH
jgi:uncharacterized membrane protein HdeD (DUF308 family)